MTRKTNWERLSAKTIESRLTETIVSALEVASHDKRILASDLLRPEMKPAKRNVLVAFSGGRDSMALLHLCVRLAQKKDSPVARVCAVHIHHGLQKEANAWASFCRKTAASLGVEFKVIRVNVKNAGDGIEAAARKARYDAIANAAKSFGCEVTLIAQHEDDLLETFLMSWMRGAGPEGLSAFPLVRDFAGGKLVRPFIETPRAALEAFLVKNEITWVDDPSNDDTTYLRNALRHKVMPVLEAIRPGFRSAATRSVALVAQMSETLDDYASGDLAACLVDARTLSVAKLLQYPIFRQALILRQWIASFGILPPAKAKLDEALRQAQVTGNDSNLSFQFGRLKLVRAGANFVMREVAREKPLERDSAQVVPFHGPGSYRFEGWEGTLYVYKATISERGFPESVLSPGLQARSRQGGEKIKLFSNRPSRHLKHWYQEADIANCDRGALPLIWADDVLIFAAGLGAEIRYTDTDIDEERFILDWVPDKTLLDLI
ncbi:MAG TPA: tRNA lysidine(34) synthetase TilS [Sutterella sp.]|nr:tRNA lysidine(34) synthetase TilS [Sutterella sp.]